MTFNPWLNQVNTEGRSRHGPDRYARSSQDAERMRTKGRIGAIAQLLRRYLGHYSQSTTSQAKQR